MALLRYAAKFDPFLSLDCAPTPSSPHPGAIQGKEGIKFCHLATMSLSEAFFFRESRVASFHFSHDIHALLCGQSEKWKIYNSGRWATNLAPKPHCVNNFRLLRLRTILNCDIDNSITFSLISVYCITLPHRQLISTILCCKVIYRILILERRLWNCQCHSLE